jgi:ATP-binding cassette subfamily F protein uup
MAPLLTLQDIHLTFGVRPLLVGAGIAVGLGDRICLVGRNGSGKSTLLRIAAGLLPPDSGRRFVQPGATIRYLPQEPDLTGFPAVFDYVTQGLRDEGELYQARYLLEQLGLAADASTPTLSGGEARRAAIAQVLVSAPDILLLDEPTNHLDLPGIEWLEQALSGLRSGIVVISHDRRLLESLSRATVWLDRGISRTLDRGFAAFEPWRDQVLEQEETERHKLARKIVAEEDWLRYGVTARRKRNVKRLADLHALRKKRREQKGAEGRVKMSASEAGLSGQMAIVADGISKSFDGNAVVRDLTLRVMRGDRLGIVGPNGAGKTTVLSMLTGTLAPDSGQVTLGTNLEMVTLDQRRDSLDPSWTLSQALTGGAGDTVVVGGQSRHVVGYMKDFLFGPEQANTPVRVLSGGERGRLMLARAFAKPSNLMILDEPTNDLDLETLELLQERLADYAGTVLLVSHDRDFIDRVVTSVLVFEGGGRWVDYAGGYTDMLAQRPPAPDAMPERVAKSPRGGAAPRPREESRAKMSFKDRHALEALPARIDTLHQQIATLSDTLASPDLYTRQPRRFAEATAALAEAQTKLAAAEEQWLTLEMRREALEG